MKNSIEKTKPKKMTDADRDFVRNNYLKLTQRELAAETGVGIYAVQYFMAKNKLKLPRHIVRTRKAKALHGRTTATPEEDAFLRDNYLKLSYMAIAKELNRSTTFVKKRLKQLNLKVPRAILQQRVRASHIQPGSIPHNKGKKMEEWMAKDKIKKIRKTQFKPNNKPHNTLPVGAEVIRDDSLGKYVMIKVPGERTLVYKSRWVWEQHHGAIPPNHNIVFKDGNTLNCNIDNLECISNEELMRRNSIHNYPEEIQGIVRLKGKLKRQINKIKTQS